MDLTAKQRDVRDIARRTILDMHRAGEPLDADEIHAAMLRTFQHYHLDEDTLRRLRVYIERTISRLRAQP